MAVLALEGEGFNWLESLWIEDVLIPFSLTI